VNVSQKTWLRWAIDPAAFVEERLGVVPDDWQKDALRSTDRTSLYNCCRQSGKTTCTGWGAAHGAIFNEGTCTVIVAPTTRQSKLLFKKVTDVFETVDVKLVEHSALECKLANGSTVVALPGDGDNIRGYTAHRVIADEFAFIPPNAKIIQAISPMLITTKGQLRVLTTPNGKSGQFYDWWIDQRLNYKRFKVSADMCSRITPADLEAERKRLGMDSLFRQEYYCEFTDTVDAIFLSDQTREALSPEVKPLFQYGSFAAGSKW
jgi:hypothetical protein